jgi:hypothetical protein
VLTDSFTYTLRLLCPNGHVTMTPLSRVVLEGDEIVDCLAGSDADFCKVCQARPEMVGYTASSAN